MGNVEARVERWERGTRRARSGRRAAVGLTVMAAGSVAWAGLAGATSGTKPTITATEATFAIPVGPGAPAAGSTWRLNLWNNTTDRLLGTDVLQTVPQQTEVVLRVAVPSTATCYFQADVRLTAPGLPVGLSSGRFYSGDIATVPGCGSSGVTTTTSPFGGGGGSTTTTSPGGGGSTTTTSPGGGSTTTTSPGGGGTTTTTGPGGNAATTTTTSTTRPGGGSTTTTDPGGGGATTTTGPGGSTPTTRPASTSASSTSPGVSGSSRRIVLTAAALPFTGFDAPLAVLVGTALVAVGLLLSRRRLLAADGALLVVTHPVLPARPFEPFFDGVDG